MNDFVENSGMLLISNDDNTNTCDDLVITISTDKELWAGDFLHVSINIRNNGNTHYNKTTITSEVNSRKATLVAGSGYIEISSKTTSLTKEVIIADANHYTFINGVLNVNLDEIKPLTDTNITFNLRKVSNNWADITLIAYLNNEHIKNRGSNQITARNRTIKYNKDLPCNSNYWYL